MNAHVHTHMHTPPHYDIYNNKKTGNWNQEYTFVCSVTVSIGLLGCSKRQVCLFGTALKPFLSCLKTNPAPELCPLSISTSLFFVYICVHICVHMCAIRGVFVGIQKLTSMSPSAALHLIFEIWFTEPGTHWAILAGQQDTGTLPSPPPSS